MGGAIISVSGKTEKEVGRKLDAKAREAENMGLSVEIRSPVVFDPGEQQYKAILKVHT